MKLYVLIRKDLSISQRAVQAGHAVAEFCKLHPNTKWNRETTGTLVYLAVDNEKELTTWLRSCAEYTDVAPFYEPYWGNSLTAFAALGIKPVERAVSVLELI